MTTATRRRARPSSSWDRSTATPQELADYAEGRGDARGSYPPQPPAGRSDKAYMAGYRGTRSSSSSSKAAGGAKSSGRAKRSSRPRSQTTRSRGPVRRSASKAQQRLVAPVERQLVSGFVLLGAAAAIAVLYNLLVHAQTTSTVIDRLTDSVTWLDSTRPIPYRHN